MGWQDGRNLEGPQTNHSANNSPTYSTAAPSSPHEEVAVEEELENSLGCLGSEAQTESNPEGTTGLWNRNLTPS